MPSGLRGLMMAGMLAAVMSDLTSIFNSASTLFTMDIWRQIRKKATITEIMIVGRSFIVVMVAISILWIPIIQQMQGGQMFIYIQAISAYLAPPIAAVYVLAILWKRMNEKGAFWALMAGLLFGLIRMALDFVYPEPNCGEEDTRPIILSKIHYMYFAMILFWLTALVSVIISLMTQPPEPFRLIRTTYWTRYDKSERYDDKDNYELRYSKHGNLQKDAGNDENEEFNERVSEKVVYPKEMSPLLKFYYWFCGYERYPDSKKEEEFNKHLRDISTLHQTKCEKVTLRIFLAMVICIAIFLYVFFSVFNFPKQ